MASLLQAEQERENTATGRIQNREVVRHFFFFFFVGEGEKCHVQSPGGKTLKTESLNQRS